MANTSISNLVAGSAVTDTDLFPDVQVVGVGPVKVTAAQIKSYTNAGLLSNLTVNSTPTSGGAAGQIMFDTGSVLQESSNLTWDNTAKRLTLTGYSLTGSAASSQLDLAGTWNTSGTPTAIKLNITDTASNASSLLMDLQVGGASKFSVTKTGDINFGSSGGTIRNGTAGRSIFLGTSAGGCGILQGDPGNNRIGFGTQAEGSIIRVTNYFALGPSWAQDLFLNRRAAANLQLGAADAAAPVAQTLSVQSVVAGTTNTAGANLTITGSQGTGTGAGGSIIFQVAPAGSSGTAQNALVSAYQMTSTKQFAVYNTTDTTTNYERGVFDWATTANTLTIGTQIGGTGTARSVAMVSGTDISFSGALNGANFYFYPGRTDRGLRINTSNNMPVIYDLQNVCIYFAQSVSVQGTKSNRNDAVNIGNDGIFVGRGYSGTSFTFSSESGTNLSDVAPGTVYFYGKPAKSNATTNISGGDFYIASGDGASSSAGAANGGNLYLDGGAAYGTGITGKLVIGSVRSTLTAFGGTTSSFPALKRSTTILQVRLSDDSAYAPVEASTVRTATAYTVATLPAAGTAGRRAYVTDATAPTFLGTLTGGGTVVCPVFDDGTNWVAG